ncbi:hypothetical protein [Kitasatospora sp. NPDC057223]|uniref:hypothetical protein n=1 Tax=Kitasatospora sp. NPDC057223 TaxID=3346055 RepID=UPI00362521AB
MSLVLTPLPGPAPIVPDRDTVDSWSLASLDAYLDAGDRLSLHAAAIRAVQLEQQGAPHLKVVSALGGAEMRAARIGPDELAFHVARLDAYSNAHNLRGWYRYTDRHGKHTIQVNKLRTAADGDVGRYYTHRLLLANPADLPYWVVDRDTGRTVDRYATAAEAARWIAAAEGRPPRHRLTPGPLHGSRTVAAVPVPAGLL